MAEIIPLIHTFRRFQLIYKEAGFCGKSTRYALFKKSNKKQEEGEINMLCRRADLRERAARVTAGKDPIKAAIEVLERVAG